MKIIPNTYLLLMLALIAQTNASFGMNIAATLSKGAISGLCSTAELFMMGAPLIDKYLFNPADLRTEKLKNVQSDAPESIISFATEIAQSRRINDVKVVLSGDTHDYSTNDNGNIILISNKQADELEELLTKTTLTVEEQGKRDEHVGLVHHELTHRIMRSLKYAPMYDAAIGMIGAISTSATVTYFANQHFPSIQKSFPLRNVFKLGRGAFTFSLAFKLMNMNLYKKYDELKADDGIPNQKELLVAQMKMYEKRHEVHLHWIDVIKERASFGDIISPPENNDFPRFQLLAMKIIPKHFFNKPIVMDAIFHAGEEHPSDLRRALRFEQRIKEVESVEITDQK